MLVRLVIEGCNAGMAANVGGTVARSVRVFDIDITDEAVEMLRPGPYYHGNVVGIELPKEPPDGRD